MADLSERVRELYRSKRVVGLANADAAQLVDMLADEDVKFRFFVGDLIARNAKGAIETLLTAAKVSPSEEVRRSAIHLLGKVAGSIDKAHQQGLKDVVVEALGDEDPKVRRNAAIALGEIGRPESVGPLAVVLEGEPFDWVRPSMVLALGQIGGPESAGVLAEIVPRSTAEAEALEKARARVAIIDDPIRDPLVTLGGREIEFHCAPGLEAVTCDGFERILGHRPRVVQNGSVRARVHAVCDLDQVRTWREWLVCVAEQPLPDASDGSVAKAGVDLLCKGLDVVAELYAKHASVPSRYRIELRGKDTSHASRRKLVKHWVDGLKPLRPGFSNNPSHYTFELRVQRAKTKVGVFLKLTEEPDTRFDYRKTDVPAAMHPATAAGVVRMSNCRKQARVLDPFCGSGTLLFERLKRHVPCRELAGSDISGNAVEAAKTNLAGAGDSRLGFRRGDVRSVRHEGRFDELISNLPYGIRTGSHDKNVDIYQALIDRLPDWMNDGASITLVTQEIDLMTELFRKTPFLALQNTQRVDTGGLQPGVFQGRYLAQAS